MQTPNAGGIVACILAESFRPNLGGTCRPQRGRPQGPHPRINPTPAPTILSYLTNIGASKYRIL
ncbi:MAG TPA: hypothetical protein VJ761_08210 [Ktedonobacteraceae bacterium]|nr:hypothetical protein [Ktedonobacteraceae bacterium]